MKKKLKILCLVAIFILVNTEALAEATKIKIETQVNSNKLARKLDYRISLFLNSDRDLKEFHQVWKKLDRSISINENNQIVNNRLELEVDNILDEESICNLDHLEDEEEESPVEESSLFIVDWCGKDRYVSIDTDLDYEDSLLTDK